MNKESLEIAKEEYEESVFHSRPMGMSNSAIEWLIEQADQTEDLAVAYNNAQKEIRILKKYRGLNREYRDALKFYANKDMYKIRISPLDGATSDIDFDKGQRARRLLEVESI